MINPSDDEFMENDPATSSMKASEERLSTESGTRVQRAAGKVSTTAANVWEQTKERAGTARERTEFYLRENPVPTVLGALAIGLAIGLAIRYASAPDERKVEAKTPLGNVDLSMLTLPFLWPFFKTVRRKYGDSADAVKENVDRLKKIDVDDYVKPLRKKWRAWTN